jgi:hypothetical protein
MLQILMCLVAILVPTELVAQVPEWHREVVVRADYGDKQDEYGCQGVAQKEEISPVQVFYVGDKRIYIEDYYQGNIKEYDLSGTFLRTITLERGAPRKVGSTMMAEPALHNICDLLVQDDVIYLLCESGLNPASGHAAVYVRSYHLATGKRIEKLEIWNSLMGRWSDKGADAYGGTSFSTGPAGTIWINDQVNHISVPMLRDGKKVPPVEQAQPAGGLTFGPRRIIINKEAGVRELMNGDSTFIRNLDFMGSYDNVVDLRASSKNGEYLLRRNSTSKMDFTISTWDGRDIGRVVWQPEKPWWSFPVCYLFQVGPDGAFYHVYPDYDAMYIYRWSK